MTGTLIAPIPYAGLGLDRAACRRADPAWVAGLAADPRAVARPMWNDECLVKDGAPLVLPAGRTTAELVLLGLHGETPAFAMDLSDLTREEALARAGADDTADLRSVFTGLPPDEAAAWAHARGLLRWHRYQRYRGRCGSPAQPRDAGHHRVCTGCGQLLFPRIEPAVITLVEVGESLEDAVRREIREEAGISLPAGHPRGRVDSIDRIMLTEWIDGK